MIKKKRNWIYSLIILVTLVAFNTSCKKDNNNPSNPTNGKTTAVFNPSITYGTITDIDDNIYKTITIGTQTWMAENLRTTKYRDGSTIPEITDNTIWENLNNGAYCNYNNSNSIDTIATFGRFYNWLTISDSRKIAPTGWHVPSDAEWGTLSNYLITNNYNYDGTTTNNKIAKALACTNIWIYNSDLGTVGNNDYTLYRNKSGFSAVPSGFRLYDGTFYDIGRSCSWWSSTEYDTSDAWVWNLSFDLAKTGRTSYYKTVGFSIRCVKD